MGAPSRIWDRGNFVSFFWRKRESRAGCWKEVSVAGGRMKNDRVKCRTKMMSIF